MTTLWLVVLVLLLATLLCLIPPLLRRTPITSAPPPDADATVRAFYLAQREQLQRDLRNGSLSPAARVRAEEELQRDLLQDLALRQGHAAPFGGQRAGIAAACVFSIIIPVAAVLLYGQLGNPRAAADATMARAAEPHSEDAGDDMALAINALAQRLRASPDDADGWYTLARSYETLGRYNDAVAAYQQVLKQVPGQPAVLADLADALLSANQGVPDASSIAAVAQALAAQPDQPKALALAGMMALRRGDAAEALMHWEHLQGLLPPESEAARQIQSNIAQARAMAAGAPAEASGAASASSAGRQDVQGASGGGNVNARANASATPNTGANSTSPANGNATATAPASAARLSGHARIAESLRSQVQPGDTVFILARPIQGSRMPLAILRLRVSDLPRPFVLDDSNAMSPDATLSRASAVQVEIRISRAGTATAQPGDLSGVLPDVAVPSDGLELVADTVLR